MTNDNQGKKSLKVEAILYLYAESPIHAGSGDSDGVADNPIQREVTTRRPVIWGQSLKGALRDHLGLGSMDPDEYFGSESGPTGETRPGSVFVGDAQVVVFPVPTVLNTFTWVTSTPVLSLLNRKLARSGQAPVHASSVDDGEAHVTATAGWAVNEVFGWSSAQTQRKDETTELAKRVAADFLPEGDEFETFRTKLERDLAVISDTDLSINLQHGTDVIPRVSLDENRQVRRGMLFFAEYLPAETLLAAVLTFPDHDTLEMFQMVCQEFPVMRLGGDQSIGKGVVWLRCEAASSAGELAYDEEGAEDAAA